MAKYVGHVVQLSNSALKLPGAGTHYVHVQWFNPRTKKFHCRIVTSLEHKISFSKGKKQMGKSPFYREKNDSVVYVFKRGHYEDIRNGTIVPVPVEKTSGFKTWIGLFESRLLPLHVMKKAKIDTGRSIEK